MSTQPGRYQRSFAGMIGAMLVLLVVVAAFVAFRDVNREEPASPVNAVDYVSSTEYARDQADFPVLAPGTLPGGWKATSVRFRNGREPSWHLGFLTDEGRYVGLEQADESAPSMVEEFVDEDAEQGEDVVVGGQSWESWTDTGGDSAYVLEGSEITTLVVGTAPPGTLIRFVTSLR